MGKLIHTDGALNSKVPEPKLVKYPLISLYKERMRESKYGRLMGIMIPTYAVVMLITLFLPKNLLFSTIMLIASLAYLISYLLFVNYESKKKEEETISKIWGSNENHEKFKKSF